MQVDLAKVRFQTVGDRHRGSLHITIFSADAKGSLLGEEWKTVEMNLREDTYQKIIQAPLPISIPIPLQDPRQMHKVVVYDYGSDLVASQLTRINAK
jgi:hypothetical protein